jgi:hypothetical protein
LPQYDESFEWAYLTEKGRYIYDAFNVQRLVAPLIKRFNVINDNFSQIYISASWTQLKKFFLYYNINQLKSQKFNVQQLLPIIGDSCDLVLINYLKHLFLRNGQNNIIYKQCGQNCGYNRNFDFRSLYLNDLQNIHNIGMCLLINITLRTENPLLNAKLRQEYLWNNTQIFQFGSKYNSAYKYAQLTNNLHNSYKILNGQISNLISVCLKQSKILCITSTANLSLFTFNFLQKLKLMFGKKNINFNINVNPTQLEQINLFETNVLNKIHTNPRLKDNHIYLLNTNTIYKKNTFTNSKYVIYQSSHFNNSYNNFVDVFLPVTTFFETRTKLYINCLGLLRRIPKIVPFYKLDILDDLDAFYFVILFLPFVRMKLNYNNIFKCLYFDLPIKLYDSIINYNIFILYKYKEDFAYHNYYCNTLYIAFYKNFYKTNNLEMISSTMTTLTNIFFNKSSNYYSS